MCIVRGEAWAWAGIAEVHFHRAAATGQGTQVRIALNERHERTSNHTVTRIRVALSADASVHNPPARPRRRNTQRATEHQQTPLRPARLPRHGPPRAARADGGGRRARRGGRGRAGRGCDVCTVSLDVAFVCIRGMGISEGSLTNGFS